ncbi:MAG: carboxypeptidase-like regulatory domain-containing protein [Candidatus Aminicenantes bacterium]|nr:carboxypeptidase-like regulatory domain-containing protein [Candidatus Aminicenantes bacterium]MDH5715388.1 carboxypeptidase-like regulatory domain-containing protein [Candidatus Aminicenantes bacterium]
MHFKSLAFSKLLVFFLAFAGFALSFPKNSVAEVEKGDIVGVVFQKLSSTGEEEVKVIWPTILQQYRPVEGAEVKAINNGTGETFFSSKTDKYGIYKIEGIPAGEYKIVVITEKKDYVSDKVLTVVANKQTAVPLMLKQTQGLFGLLIPIGSGAALGYLMYKVYASPVTPGS